MEYYECLLCKNAYTEAPKDVLYEEDICDDCEKRKPLPKQSSDHEDKKIYHCKKCKELFYKYTDDSEINKVVCPECEDIFMKIIMGQKEEIFTKECYICYEQKPDTIVYPCKHTFHLYCIKSSEQYNKTCPICRQKITIFVNN